ncbi:methylcytosine dioxygenase TET3 isoform X2 [Hippocampus comes]|uniref:methylcytosine dioxygenase TET3 isoform X1 n=2 Tax=Hippocampus comes TaxID=109280 RepID=UPI00094F16E6|nr:PREDICTED: methylcytosine dioxygenase TET3-like isoform X1 [Hippocampus comes]XP_019740728.1 PREDICTED: methylcytosine dioxygenase TET3-like isoform X2 [Hippocampus comes]
MPKPRAASSPPSQDVHAFFSSDVPNHPANRKSLAKTSPLSMYIESEHHQAGLFSLSPTDTRLDATFDPQKKRRKKCGTCAPCLRKENCGTCVNCLNRKTGKQICKLRKCEELKKRRDTWETVHEVTSLDGPRGGDQMEIGSHDRLQEGVLSLELPNGVNCDPNDDEASIETEQKRATDVPQKQCWVPTLGKVQQQALLKHNSSYAKQSKPVHHVDMEDAHNLVTFSALAGTLPPSTTSSCVQVQPDMMQLYEKFTQEMGADGARVENSAGAPNASHPSSEDMKTLQAALNHAKHGRKPPNCDCDGPDCPDYLEWLKKKIKLAASENQDTSKRTDSPHVQPNNIQHSHLQNQPYLQANGDHQHSTSSYLQQQQRTNAGQVACSKLPPIPCSPQVLSIAKERNVSLQTAIAIEALTQLSGTGTQGPGAPDQALLNNNLHHHQHTQNLTSPLLNCTKLIPSSAVTCPSSRSQSIPPGFHTDQQAAVSCEHHRPQSQGQPPHASTSPFRGQGNPQTFGRSPKQWLQDTRGASEERLYHDAGTPRTRPDPMSELKDLLGDTSGKFGNSSFKLPSTQQLTENEGVPRKKQETDVGDHSASKGHYNLDNGQLQVRHYPGTPMSPGQAAIRHSTQAALQQHLHYKRNLFSSHSPGFGASAAPFQNLKKWWPQMEANAFNHLSIKQELKEPKRKKNSQVSPVMKAMSGMLPGPVLPKPKQIIIKKSKQKASVPAFLPKSQITVEKTSVLMMGRGNTPNNLQPDSLPLLSSHSNSTQVIAAGFPAPAQSQVSISNLSMAPSSTHSALSMNNPTLMGSVPPQTAHGTDAKAEEVGSLVHSDVSTASSLTSTSIPNTSQLSGLINIDPKYEELILQFEAEFGDSAADTPSTEAMSETAIASQIMNQSQTSAQDLTSPTTQHQPSSNHTPESSYTPHRNKKETDASKDESEVQRELTSYQTSTVTPVKEQQDPHSAISQNQDCPLDKHPQQSQIQETFSIPSSPIAKRMKFEASGDVAVLSTTCFSEEDTPTKDGLPFSPSLKGFLESPLKFLDTPTRSLLDTPSKDLQADSPNCTCVEQPPEKDEGPYYNHLGSGPTVASIRDLMETRYGEKGEAIRIEKVVYTGREGKSSRGCPIAKWVIRRGSEKEKILCLVRHRAGHHCANAVIIILIMAWEGVPRSMADTLYREISDTLTKFGNPTTRRCGLNDDRTCACQGKDPDTCGASFSFGCSWSMYFNGCKYARSKTPRKFRLQGERPEEENKLRDQFQNLATEVAPLYKKLAPQAYSNQCQSETKASDCRLGLKAGRPFAGVTACLDFCAHAHKDQHNLYNGCTVVCTLTKEDNRSVGEIPPDEQLHVLPLYKLSTTDEFGSEEGQHLKMKTGAIQVLQAFRREVRKLPEPAKSSRQRRLDAKKAASEKKKTKLQQQAAETPEKTVVRTEGCFSESPQPPGNKDPAIIKQEFKANIKKDPFNGPMDGYGLQTADAIKTMCPNPAYYARGGLPTTGPPSAGDPVNGYNHNLPASHYGFFNFPSNALFAPKMRTYEGRNSSLPKAGRMAFQVDKKPDIHSLQARLAHSYPDHIEQPNQVNSQPSDYNQSRPSSVSSESSNRGTPVIKQEPMDMPVCEVTEPSQGATSTPSSTPQPNTWPGNRFNGSVVPTNWDHRNPKQRHEDFFSHEEKQMLHPHPQQQPSPYPQPWTSLAGSDTSPVPHVPPSSSPHLGAPGNIQQGSPRPPTPRPSTPHPGTPQPSLTQPFLLPHLGNSQSPSHIPQPVTPRQWASPAPSPEPNSRAMAHGAYSPGLKHSSPAGAYPDKMWSKTGEIRCSTPLGVQEKAWKSCGGSAAGSTPSPAPEGRLFPDALQQSDQAFWDRGRSESDGESTKGREEDDDEVWSDSEHNFLDPNIGGVAVAPTHGSILIECARRELHATTPLKKPDRSHPSRISLVFYQHKNLQQPMHGLALWEAKMKMLAERALQRQQEAALLGLSQDELKALSKKRKWGATAAGAMSGVGQSKEKREGPVTRLAPTFHTTSMVNVSPYTFTRLTGPYSCLV